MLVQCALGIALLGPGRWREPRVRRAGLALRADDGGRRRAGRGVAPGARGRPRRPLDGPRSPPATAPVAGRGAALPRAPRARLGDRQLRARPRAARPGLRGAGRQPTARRTAPSLQVAAERGLVGLLGLALLVVAAIVSAREGLRRDADRPMAVGRALALAGAATYGLVQYVWYLPAVGVLVWMVARLRVGSPRRADRAARPPRRAGPRGPGGPSRGVARRRRRRAAPRAGRPLVRLPPAGADRRAGPCSGPRATRRGASTAAATGSSWTSRTATRTGRNGRCRSRSGWTGGASPSGTCRAAGRPRRFRSATRATTARLSSSSSRARPSAPSPTSAATPRLPAPRDERELGVVVRTLRVE